MIFFWLLIIATLLIAGALSYTSILSVAESNAPPSSSSSSGNGKSKLAELTDLHLTSPSDGDLLIYSSQQGKWINGSLVLPMVEISVLGNEADQTAVPGVELILVENVWTNLFGLIDLPSRRFKYTDHTLWTSSDSSNIQWIGSKTVSFDLAYSVSAQTRAPNDNFYVALMMNGSTIVDGSVRSYDFSTLNTLTTTNGSSFVTLAPGDYITVMMKRISKISPPPSTPPLSKVVALSMILRATSLF